MEQLAKKYVHGSLDRYFQISLHRVYINLHSYQHCRERVSAFPVSATQPPSEFLLVWRCKWYLRVVFNLRISYYECSGHFSYIWTSHFNIGILLSMHKLLMLFSITCYYKHCDKCSCISLHIHYCFHRE
jgi:hypothetical protein